MDMPRGFRAQLLLIVGLVAICVGTGAHGAPIAADPFVIGAGAYTAGGVLHGQGPAVAGFSGTWSGTTHMWSDTLNLSADPNSGSVKFLYPTVLGERQLYRQLASYTAGQPVYYMSGQMYLDPRFGTSSTAWSYIKMLGIGGSTTRGLRFGFCGDGTQIDARVNLRDPDGATRDHVIQDGVAPGTHSFVFKVEQNYSGNNDRVSVWLDPLWRGSEASAGPPLIQFDSDAFDDADQPLNRVYLAAANTGDGVPARYDAIRYGTTWADAAPPLTRQLLLEENFGGAAGSQPVGFTSFADAGMAAENDGSGEYQLRKVSDGNWALGYYDNPDDTVRGVWRDTTITTTSRYSAGGSNLNGLVFRARDITDAGGANGDFYHVRFEGNRLILIRWNNGVATRLAGVDVEGGLGSIKNRWLRVSVANIPNPATDHVRVLATLSENADLTHPVATLDFTDTASNAITRGGGVGYRTQLTAGSGNRAVFDNLTVVGDNRRLLWYDDYYDNEAPKMAIDGRSGYLTGGKILFGGSGTGIATLDYDAITSLPEWQDVEVSTLMRVDGNAAHNDGLVLGERGVTGAADGSGDFYLYTLNRTTGQAELYRHNDGGGLSLLAATAVLATDIPTSTNIFLTARVLNHDDRVGLMAMASLSADFSSPYGIITFQDLSPDRIIGPGSVGFRVSGAGSVNFDNLTVEVYVPEPATLLLLGGGLAAAALRRRRKG